MEAQVFSILFYLTAAIAVIASLLVITRYNAVHALLYLIVSSLSVAIIFYLIGAPFAAALEMIIYAGAIMILFVFVVMMLNLGKAGEEQERQWLSISGWVGPALLSMVLLFVLISHFYAAPGVRGLHEVGAKQVGIALFGPYVLVVELASFLLMAGLVGAYHIARPPDKSGRGKDPSESSSDSQGTML